MTMFVTNGDDRNQSHNQFAAQVVKASLLGSIAVFSTWIFIFVGMMLIPEIGWFVTIDSTINGITIYLMFNFAEKTYLFFCKPFAVMCYCCFGGKNVAKQAKKDKRFLTIVRNVSTQSKTEPDGGLSVVASRSPTMTTQSSIPNPLSSTPASLNINNNDNQNHGHAVSNSQEL